MIICAVLEIRSQSDDQSQGYLFVGVRLTRISLKISQRIGPKDVDFRLRDSWTASRSVSPLKLTFLYIAADFAFQVTTLQSSWKNSMAL